MDWKMAKNNFKLGHIMFFFPWMEMEEVFKVCLFQ